MAFFALLSSANNVPKLILLLLCILIPPSFARQSPKSAPLETPVSKHASTSSTLQYTTIKVTMPTIQAVHQAQPIHHHPSVEKLRTTTASYVILSTFRLIIVLAVLTLIRSLLLKLISFLERGNTATTTPAGPSPFHHLNPHGSAPADLLPPHSLFAMQQAPLAAPRPYGWGNILNLLGAREEVSMQGDYNNVVGSDV